MSAAGRLEAIRRRGERAVQRDDLDARAAARTYAEMVACYLVAQRAPART